MADVKVPLLECLAHTVLVLVVIAQAVFLDTQLVEYAGPDYSWFIIVDLGIVLLFIVGNSASCEKRAARNPTSDSPPSEAAGAQPSAYVVWAPYSLFMAVRIVIMFKTFARTLPIGGLLGVNALKTAIGLTAGVYALVVATHHRLPAGEKAAQRYYLAYMEKTVAFELLDSVQLLSVLFVNESRFLLSWHLENAILGFGCAALLLPLIPLVQLAQMRSGVAHPSELFCLVHALLHAALVNIPFMLIRLYLWHYHGYEAGMFLLKNMFGVVGALFSVLAAMPFCKRINWPVLSMSRASVAGGGQRDSQSANAEEIPMRVSENPSASQPPSEKVAVFY